MDIEEYKPDLDIKNKFEKYGITSFMKCFEFLIKTGYKIEEAFSTSLYHFEIDFSDVMYMSIHQYCSFDDPDIIYVKYKENRGEYKHLDEFLRFNFANTSTGDIKKSSIKLEIKNRRILNFLIRKISSYCENKGIKPNDFYQIIDEDLPF